MEMKFRKNLNGRNGITTDSTEVNGDCASILQESGKVLDGH